MYNLPDGGYSTTVSRIPGIPNTSVSWGDNLYGSSVIVIAFPHHYLTMYVLNRNMTNP
ncbi:hypothetical protein BDV97DRAFT_363189, partial [Delphinella strobiligena]